MEQLLRGEPVKDLSEPIGKADGREACRRRPRGFAVPSGEPCDERAATFTAFNHVMDHLACHLAFVLSLKNAPSA
ncbi:MAG: hypothetical protein WCD75_06975, partial [Rhodoplanes sp.]